jgi:hypothetical protein
MRAVRSQAEDGMTDETKVASEAEVREAVLEAVHAARYTQHGRNPEPMRVSDIAYCTALADAALTAARAMGVLMPEEAAKLRAERDHARWAFDNVLAGAPDPFAERDTLAARVNVLEEAILWADGLNGGFLLRGDGEGPYYWRRELMERAAIGPGHPRYDAAYLGPCLTPAEITALALPTPPDGGPHE